MDKARQRVERRTADAAVRYSQRHVRNREFHRAAKFRFHIQRPHDVRIQPGHGGEKPRLDVLRGNPPAELAVKVEYAGRGQHARALVTFETAQRHDAAQKPRVQ